MILALALATVAVLTLVALSLSALRAERKSSDTLVGQLVADDAMEKLIYDMQSNSAHPAWVFNQLVNTYDVSATVSSETDFSLATYARDVDSLTFTPRRLKRLEIVAHWWRSDNNAGAKAGMGKLEAHAIRLIREP